MRDTVWNILRVRDTVCGVHCVCVPVCSVWGTLCVVYICALLGHSHALLLRVLGAVCAVEELSLEELHGNHGEDEHEELVHDEDVEDVL